MTERLKTLRAAFLEKHVPVMRPHTAQLLASLCEEKKPERALEIGTCVGLGVVCMLLHGAKNVTTIEIDEDRYYKAKETIASFGLTDKCECILGDCREIVPLMENNRYDLIVLDGPKTYYREFLPYLKKMLTDGGVVFCDDVSFYGLVEGDDLPARKHRTNVLSLREFTKAVKNDNDFSWKEYEIEDGVLVLFHRG